MKKMFSLLLAMIFVFSVGSVFAEEKTVSPEVEAANLAVKAAVQSCEMYFTYYTAYEFDSLLPLFIAYGNGKGYANVDESAMTEAELLAYKQKLVDDIETAKSNVVQVCERESVRVDFWNDPENIPTVTEYTENTSFYVDDPGFIPFMIHVPVPEGVEIKGAMVILGGAGRNNMQEGWNYSNFFSAAGYQCFVMNYRLRPYTADESDADVQRAIRYVRAHAEEYGIKQDQIVLIGNSAGGMRLASMLKGSTGTEKYEFDATYVPDQIDEISFMPNALISTASSINYTTEDIVDPSTFPAMFYTCGTGHSGLRKNYNDAALFYDLGVPFEIHTWEGVPHSMHMGYDNYSGVVYTNAAYWGDLALEWIDRAFEMGRGGCVD